MKNMAYILKKTIYQKTKNPFKKILDDVISFVKKDEEDNKPYSFETSKTGKNHDSNIPKPEVSKTRKANRSKHERKANNNEQKLPKKLKKGW